MTSRDVFHPRKIEEKHRREIDEAIKRGDEIKSQELEERYTQRSQLPTRRINWKKIAKALKIYDLATCQGKKPDEIARELYPNHFHNNSDVEHYDSILNKQETTIREINRYLKKAKEMIRTGELWIPIK